MSSETPVSSVSEEKEQIRQTIEMFEVIIQANPQDTHSMEILKEAYMNGGEVSKAHDVGRRLAEVYVELGQYSSALLEYEGILQMDPDNAEIIVALGDLSQRLHNMQQEEMARQGGNGAEAAALNELLPDSGDLIVTAKTQVNESSASLKPSASSSDATNEANETLCKFLIQNRIISEDIASKALDAIRGKNKDRSGQQLAVSLIHEAVTRGALELDLVLSGILNRCKFAYIPLEIYEIDRQVIRMLPENLTFGHLMVPFDMISRTLMIAVSNPFDAVGRQMVQQQLDYHIQWYLASPAVISKVITDSYRLDAR